MYSNINTNLDNYTINELIDLLELTVDYTREEVITKINFINETYF